METNAREKVIVIEQGDNERRGRRECVVACVCFFGGERERERIGECGQKG